MILQPIANPLFTPLVLGVWLLDAYLILSAIRLVLGQLHTRWAIRTRLALQRLTDPLPQATCHWLAARRSRPIPTWLPWAIVMVATIITRQLLVWILVSTS